MFVQCAVMETIFMQCSQATFEFPLFFVLNFSISCRFSQWLIMLHHCKFPPFSSLLGCLGGEYQRKLYRDLMQNYNRLERPVQNDSAPIVVELGLTLLQIIDVVSVYRHARVQWEMNTL